MNWLVYVPVHNVRNAYPVYSRDEIAPVHKWNEYRASPKLKGTEEFWRGNSIIDPVRGSYCGAPIRLLKTDYTFGWTVDSFDVYDAVIVCGTDEAVFLRKQKRYRGIIVTMPRLPLGFLRWNPDIINCSNLILLNHEPGVETVQNFNKKNKTDKFFLLTVPTIDTNFLTECFFKKTKTKRIITYRASSGPPRSKGAINFQTLKRRRNTLFHTPFLHKLYMRTLHKTAKKFESMMESDRIKTLKQTATYLREFQKRLEVEGYMCKSSKEDVVAPFKPINIKYADDFYRFIADSRLIVLASATYASITLYGACVGTPCVGSKDTTMQKLLFPELSFDEDDVSGVARAMVKLFEDEDFFVEQQKQGLNNVKRWFSDESLKERFCGFVRECSS